MTGRGKHVVVGDIFQGGGLGGSSFLVGGVDDDPPKWARTWGFSRTGWPILSQKYSCSSFGAEIGISPPPLEEAMEEEMWQVSLKVVEAYFLRRNNTVMGIGKV